MLASGCLGGSKRSLLFGHFLSSELFNGGLDLFLKAGIVTVEGTAEARLFIEDNEHGAVDEQIFGSSLFCGRLFLGDEFQAFDNEFGDVVLWTGKKPPATIVCFETGGILLEDRRGVVGGICSEGQEADWRVGRKAPLEIAHLAGHDGAGSAAASENNVGESDAPEQC